ncbi:MAG: ribonuclease Y [Desulfobacterales bacterium C00003060]|nr:MAG: ribonuclease Y [Desulfobacterales bacterium S3730MH5]OEU79414.1 MAG: ribonuclease Y [Desulfobacterales bacterium C00003060]OEU82389.1 MAG: ribonuclease Y [Desulfobacterales bacterium S5133MH4]
MEVSLVLFLCIILFAAGSVIGFWIRTRLTTDRIRAAEHEARRITEQAQEKADTIQKEAKLHAKDQVYQLKVDFENQTKEIRFELKKLQRRLTQKEESLERKTEQLENRDRSISKKEQRMIERERWLHDEEKKYGALIEEQTKQLERLSGLTAEEAKDFLIKAMENEARYEAAKLVKRIENESRREAERRARKIMATAIQRYAGDFVTEKTVSVVNLPSDEMKGRIIGREGRNIRALEAATGIDLIIDDTPEAVILSGFNPVRREVARLSLERLINDGRIHPARIEETVAKVTKEIDGEIREAGEQAAFDLGVHGIHAELIQHIGKLKFRTSYGQNVLRHSVEVGFLCGIMAAELGMNVKQGKRAGLLHDIGKSIDHEVEGPHAVIGAKLAKKYGESPIIVDAISAHHEDVPPTSVLAVLLQAADTLSGARPGARREILETYVKRLEELEAVAKSFIGISKSYAIQAGRELRIIAESETVSDADVTLLSREIAKKIEESMSYPGQIKVTVIRETRAVEYAK